MIELILYILLQVLNLEATHVIGGLLAIINFLVLIFIADIRSSFKDIRASLRELHALYTEHDRDITTLKAENKVKAKR
jgi:hypothetical protein